MVSKFCNWGWPVYSWLRTPRPVNFLWLYDVQRSLTWEPLKQCDTASLVPSGNSSWKSPSCMYDLNIIIIIIIIILLLLLILTFIVTCHYTYHRQYIIYVYPFLHTYIYTDTSLYIHIHLSLISIYIYYIYTYSIIIVHDLLSQAGSPNKNTRPRHCGRSPMVMASWNSSNFAGSLLGSLSWTNDVELTRLTM